MDEHFYGKPDAIIKRQSRYDKYPRNSAKVFLGEYAAHSSIDSISPWPKNLNNFESALGEAVFMTGLERNSDVVAMTCYAPLFSLVGGEQWAHNLINFNPVHVLKTTNYFVQKMFSSNIGTEVVEIYGKLPIGVYASATASKDRIFIKLVNTNLFEVQAQVNLPGIPNGKAQIEYMQSDNLKAANSMKFNGTPEYRIEPKSMEILIRDCSAALDLNPYGVYVLVINRYIILGL